jgi:hypothetical protein
LIVSIQTYYNSECTYLQTNDDRIKVQHRLPIFTQNVQAHVALQIDVGVIDFLCTLDFRRIVGKVLVDLEIENEAAALVHALVWLDGQGEVQNVVRIGEIGLHGRAE